MSLSTGESDARYQGYPRRPGRFRSGAGAPGLWTRAPIADDLLEKDKALRELLTRLQTGQARRNEASKLIGQAKAKKDEAQAAALMAEVAGLKDAHPAGGAGAARTGRGAEERPGGDSQSSRPTMCRTARTRAANVAGAGAGVREAAGHQ